MVKGYVYTLGTKVLVALLNLLTVILISNYLGANGKGEQSLILTTISLVVVVSGLVGSGALVFLVPRKNIGELLIPSYAWAIIVSFLVYFFLFFFHVVKPCFVMHVAVLSGILSITGINQSVLQGKKEISKFNFVLLSQVLFTTISLLYSFFCSKASIDQYLMALYVGYVMSLFVSIYFLFPFVRGQKVGLAPTLGNMFELFKYGKYNQFATMAQMLSFRMSFYILFIFKGNEEVGILSTGFAIGEAIWIISKSFSVQLQAEIVNHEDLKDSCLLALRLFKITITLSFISIIPFLILPGSFYSLIFGEEFYLVKSVLSILTPGLVIYSTGIVLSHYFSGTGQHRVNSIASFSGLIIMMCLCYLLIPYAGFQGAALACSLSYIVTAGIKIYFFRKQSGFRVKDFLVSRADIDLLFSFLYKKKL